MVVIEHISLTVNVASGLLQFWYTIKMINSNTPHILELPRRSFVPYVESVVYSVLAISRE